MGLTITLLRIPTSVSAAADRPASYGNKIISSTRPSCWIQISTVMCDQHCDRPSGVYDTDRRTKLTALETISRWHLLKKNEQNRSLSHPFGHLGVKYALHLWLVGKPMVWLYIRRNWAFFAISYGWDVVSGNRSKSAFFEGVGHFERRFQREGGVAHQPLLVSSSRVTALSCGIKISVAHYLDLSQSTRDKQTDRQTDKTTTLKTVLAYARAVKILMATCHCWSAINIGKSYRTVSGWSSHWSRTALIFRTGFVGDSLHGRWWSECSWLCYLRVNGWWQMSAGFISSCQLIQRRYSEQPAVGPSTLLVTQLDWLSLFTIYAYTMTQKKARLLPMTTLDSWVYKPHSAVVVHFR